MNSTRLLTFLKSNFVKNVVVYGITNAFYSGLPLILMPFLVTILKPDDYGVIDLFRTLCMVLVPVLGISTVQSVTRFFYDLENKIFKEYVSTIIIFHFIMTIVGIVLLMSLSFLLSPQYVNICFLSILFFLFNQITECCLAIYRVEKNAGMYFVIRISTVVLDLLLLYIFFIYLDDYDWKYRVYPNVISTIFVGVLVIGIFVYKKYNIVFNKKLLKKALIYSSPLVLHMLSGYILNLGDRFFILYYLNEYELGRYAVSYQIGMAINFFYTSFNLAWTPTFFELMLKKDYIKIKRIEKYVYIFLPILGIITFGVFLLLKKFLPSFSSYDISNRLVFLIIISYIFLSLYKLKTNYLMFTKETKLLSLLTLISAGVAILLNVILLPILGIEGAAISTLVSFLLLFVLVFKKSSRCLEKV